MSQRHPAEAFDRPSLEALRDALRRPMPPGFTWSFSYCHQCAMGLAWKLWPKQIRNPQPTPVAEALEMDHQAAYDLFYYPKEAYYGATLAAVFRNGGPLKYITPTVVADAIDRYLATQRRQPEFNHEESEE